PRQREHTLREIRGDEQQEEDGRPRLRVSVQRREHRRDARCAAAAKEDVEQRRKEYKPYGLGGSAKPNQQEQPEKARGIRTQQRPWESRHQLGARLAERHVRRVHSPANSIHAHVRAIASSALTRGVHPSSRRARSEVNRALWQYCWRIMSGANGRTGTGAPWPFGLLDVGPLPAGDDMETIDFGETNRPRRRPSRT